MFKLKLRKYTPSTQEIEHLIQLVLINVDIDWKQLDYVVTATHPGTSDYTLLVDGERNRGQFPPKSSEHIDNVLLIQRRMQKDGLVWCQMWLKVQKDASGNLTHELTFNYDSEFTTPPNQI